MKKKLNFQFLGFQILQVTQIFFWLVAWTALHLLYSRKRQNQVLEFSENYWRVYDFFSYPIVVAPLLLVISLWLAAFWSWTAGVCPQFVPFKCCFVVYTCIIFGVVSLPLGLWMCCVEPYVYREFVVCIIKGYVKLVVIVARLIGVKKQIGDSVYIISTCLTRILRRQESQVLRRGH